MPSFGVRWQSGSGDTAFGRARRWFISTRFGRAKAAWCYASRRSPKERDCVRSTSRSGWTMGGTWRNGKLMAEERAAARSATIAALRGKAVEGHRSPRR
jgi:hypothetical protein